MVSLPALVVGLLLLVAAASISESQIITKKITHLPGYEPELPSPLETGYITVGANKDVKLFYYFVQSEKSPKTDPLLIWINGGPTCSGAAGFFFESGPLTFTIKEYDQTLPQLRLNEFRWTQEVNMIYLDAPVGTGFSYSTNTSVENNDSTFVSNSYEFIQEWIKSHPDFEHNPVFLGGDGYSGKPVPMIISDIINGNDAGRDPYINITGYVLGDPGTDDYIDFQSQITFANQMSLIPDRLYESAMANCGGDFTTMPLDCSKASPTACEKDRCDIITLLGNINWMNILEPNCKDVTNAPFQSSSARRYLDEQYSSNFLGTLLQNQDESDIYAYTFCRNYAHKLCATWANYPEVQAVLDPEGKTTSWLYCIDGGGNFQHTVSSVVEYQKNLARQDLRALIYCGDHDISIPHIGVQKWLKELDLAETESWRAWSVANETAGYTTRYRHKKFDLTFATVKGGGHFAAETNVKECSVLVKNWFGNVAF